MKFFEAKTTKERIAIHRLRYHVYCIEKGYLSPDDYPDQVEFDKWDICSAQFVALNSNAVIGTARLIQDSSFGFPIEQIFGIKTPKRAAKSYAEFSRLIISRDYRTLNSNVTIGLYKAMLVYSQDNGIKYWYAVLDERLAKLYKRMGFLFKQLDQPMECFGCINAPYVLSLSDTLDHLAIYKPQLYTFLTSTTKSLTFAGANTNKQHQY